MSMMLAAAPEAPTFVTHLECGYTGERYEADVLHNLSKAGKPLLVRYDLDAVKAAVSKDLFASREPTLWRYRELLPVRKQENCVSLGELVTPVLPLPGMEKATGAAGLLVKDEGRLPTGSFKARGLVMAAASDRHWRGSRRGARSTSSARSSCRRRRSPRASPRSS